MVKKTETNPKASQALGFLLSNNNKANKQNN